MTNHSILIDKYSKAKELGIGENVVVKVVKVLSNKTLYGVIQ